MDFASLLADPANARAMYAAIRDRIRAQGVVGHAHAVSKLCIAGVALLAATEGSRRMPQVILIAAPPGTGKTTLALAFARALPGGTLSEGTSAGGTPSGAVWMA